MTENKKRKKKPAKKKAKKKAAFEVSKKPSKYINGKNQRFITDRRINIFRKGLPKNFLPGLRNISTPKTRLYI